MATPNKHGYCLYLLGSPRLVRDDDVDVSPRMLKSRCLLAFLALRHGAPTERARLQDLLWSTRSTKCGRDSLKKALADIRGCFPGDHETPLLTKGGPVSLDLSDIKVDVLDDLGSSSQAFDQPEFLEGVDLPDDPFNEWVRRVRINLEDRPAKASAKIGNALSSSPRNQAVQPSQLFNLAILPLVVMDTDQRAFHLGNLLANAFIARAQQCGLYSCYDLRSGRESAQSGAPPCDVLISIDATCLKDEYLLGFVARQVGTNRMIWSQSQALSVQDLLQSRLEVMASRSIDQLSERLLRFDGFGTDAHLAARQVLSAIDHIFRLTSPDLEIAEELLQSATQKHESSVFLAWQTHLSAFKAEKNGRMANPHLLEKTRELANRALELDRQNPTTIALVAHAYSFVLRDIETARALISGVRDQASKSALLADTMAMVEFYQGNYQAAHKLAVLAASKGRYSPYRYSFTTSVAMTNLMLGNYKTAIQDAKTAILQHPVIGGHVYEPTLRTLAASYGLDGQLENGRNSLMKLISQDQGFDFDQLNSIEDAPFPNPKVLDVVRSGLERLHA